MFQFARCQWLLSAVAALAAVDMALGQGTPAPLPVIQRENVPSQQVAAVTSVYLPVQVQAPGGLPSALVTPVAAPGDAEDCNGPLLQYDANLDPPDCPRPGWFTGLDLYLVKPRVRSQLIGDVTPANAVPTLVQVPQVGLDWAVSPRIEIGYRIPQGFGELILGYRFVASDGDRRATLLPFPGPNGAINSRLDLNIFDFDYASEEFSVCPDWFLKWRVGARLGQAFFDSRFDGLMIEQRVSNQFVGFGPHLSLDVWRALHWNGMSVFGRIDGATMLGRIHQSFERTALVGTPLATGAALVQHGSQGIPTLNLQAGVAWVPNVPGNWLRLSCGYQFEQWWYLGRLESSAAELSGHGLFFRAECAY